MSNTLSIRKFNRKIPTSVVFLQLAVFFAPFRSYGLFDIAGFNVSFFRFFSILMIVFMIIEFIRSNKKVPADKYVVLIYIIICYNVFTLFYSGNFTNSHFMAMTIGLIWVFFAYILINVEKSYFISIIKVFIYSSVIPIILGLFQWIYYQINGVIPEMPLSLFLVSEGKTGITFNTLLRITSTFLDPSYYGMFLAMVATMILGIIIHKDKTVKLFGSKFMKNIHLILIFSIFGIVQSLSLTAIVGFTIGSIILVAYSKKRLVILSRILILSLVMIFFISLYNFIFSYNIFESILFKAGAQFDRYGLDFGREEYFKLGVQRFLQSPIFGVGFGDVSVDGIIISSAHNTLLTILAQQGLIGLLLHLSLLIIFPILNIWTNPKGKNYLSIIMFSSLFAMVTVSLGYDAMYKIDSGYVVLLFLIFLTSKYTNSIICNSKERGEDI